MLIDNLQKFRSNTLKIMLFLGLFFGVSLALKAQVAINQVDDFNDGTTQGWTRGIVDTFVTNQSNQLRVRTINTFTSQNGVPNSKLIVYNNTQWKGDYISQGITSIRLKISSPLFFNASANNDTLNIRIAIGSTTKPGSNINNTIGTWFVSEQAIKLTPSMGVVEGIISIKEEDVNKANGGTDSYASVLSDVQALRIFLARSPSSPIGDNNIVGIVLIDDITACGDSSQATETDLSDDRMNPTMIAFSETMDTISNCQQGDDPGPRDIDYFTFNVPEDTVLSELILKNYEGLDAAGFIGIQAGTTFTVDPFSPSASELLGGLTYGTNHIGMDILPLMGNLGMGFTPPLAAGNYTIWLNQTGPESCATFEFALTPSNDCATNLTFTNETVTAATHKAADTIKTIGDVVIANNSTVIFQAGKAIQLNSGFHAVAGSDFLAQITDCTPAFNSPILQQEINQQELSNPLSTEIPLKVYPNPFYNNTTIEYQLNREEKVNLFMYDLSGKLIKAMVKNELQPAGVYQYDFNKADLKEGMYLLYLKTDKEQLIKKMILID